MGINTTGSKNSAAGFLFAGTLSLLFIIFISTALVAFADTTAAVKPTATSNVFGVSNVANAYDASTTTYATWSSSSNTATFTNFNISIPAGATIDAVTVSLSGKRDSVTGGQTARQLTVAVSADGTNFSSTQTTSFDTSDSTQNFTGATSKWGQTWTPDSFNNNLFKVRIGAILATNNKDALLGNISVTVTYTPAPPCTVNTANNKVANPCLETGFSAGSVPANSFSNNWGTNRWGTNNAAFSIVGNAHSGTKAAQVSISSYTSGDAKWYFQEVPVVAGQYYTYSSWYKSNVPTEVDIFFSGANPAINQLIADVPAAADWTQVQESFLVPNGVTSVTIAHILSSVGTLTTDDYSLVQGVAPVFAQGVVTLTFDDGWLSFSQNAAPVLTGKNLKATVYLNSKPIQESFSGYMHTGEIASIVAQGFDIGGHTATHADLTQAGVNLADEVNANRAYLQSIAAPSQVTTFAYPYGAYNQTVIDHLNNSAGYKGARTVDEGYNLTNENPYKLKIQHVTNATTPVEIQNWIDTAVASKVWLILMFHEIVPDANYPGGCLGVPDATECAKVSTLQSVVNYLSDNHVCVLTMDQMLPLSANPPCNHAPSFTSSAVTAGVSNSVYTYNVTATDPDVGNVLTITASTLPAWLTLTPTGNGTATLSGVPTDAHIGANPVTLHVSDGSLTSDQSFTITVAADNVPPTLAQVTPVPTPTNVAMPSYTFSSTEAGTITYGGDCSSTTNVAVAGNNTIVFNALAEGVHANCTITVTDNSASQNASAPLAVSSFTIDLTKPVITIIGDAVIATTTQASAYSDAGATATDNPGAMDITANIVTTGFVNLALPGTYTIHYNVTDAAGNAADEKIRTINVSDATAPVITGADIAAEATGPNGAIVSYPEPSVTDDVDTGLTATCMPASGSQFAIGITIVSCTATDTAGNVGAGSFSVTVSDGNPPIITPPADQTFEATGPLTIPTLVPATATDIVDPAPVVTYAPHSFPVGTTMVTWTATDASGNSSTAGSNVTITDTTAPVIALSGEPIVFVLLNGTYTEAGAVATDIVDGVFAATPSGVVDTTTEGVYIMTYNAQDAAHNAATPVTRTVVVSELELFSQQSVNVSETSVTINWTTSHPGTSRVLYDTVSHDPLTSSSGPNYGYAFSTAEDAATTTNHSVVVTGLSAGTTYYFRPISHGSPEVLGSEMTVTTQAPPSSQTPAAVNAGGNGAPVGLLGLNGGMVLGASTVASPGGQVLGVSTGPSVRTNAQSSCYQFKNWLAQGMRGNEVVELQKILIAGGFLKIEAPTGYFGAMTKNAVMAYQKAHALPQVGSVGPLTRAALNACTGGGSASSDNSAQVAALQEQIKLLTVQLQALIAARIPAK